MNGEKTVRMTDADVATSEIEDLIWKTFTLDHIPPAFSVELRRILAGLVTRQP